MRATIDLYGERFYDQVLLEDFAERAGVTVQTLIRRFGSKDELISAVAEASREAVRGQRDESPVGDIASAAKALVKTYENHGDRVLRMLAQEDRALAFRLITGTAFLRRSWPSGRAAIASACGPQCVISTFGRSCAEILE
jgi:AcrR family transcriptional regulator